MVGRNAVEQRNILANQQPELLYPGFPNIYTFLGVDDADVPDPPEIGQAVKGYYKLSMQSAARWVTLSDGSLEYVDPYYQPPIINRWECWVVNCEYPGYSPPSPPPPPALAGSGNGVDATYPGELPLWLAEGHGFENTPLTDDVRWEQGEDRDRQIYTWAPQIASVSALYTQEQYDRWVDFYEEELKAGTKTFATRVAHQAGGIVEWWKAQIVAPPREETLNRAAGTGGNLYRVSMQLLLLDGPYEDHTPSTLRGRARMKVSLKAVSNVGDGVLRARGSMATHAYWRSVIATRITEGGADRVTEDGQIRGLES
jgi:hypothetical protein